MPSDAKRSHWHDCLMTERGIVITGELAAALSEVLGPRPVEPEEVDVLAEFLDLISRQFGPSASCLLLSLTAERTERLLTAF